jgi:hypothetical protein
MSRKHYELFAAMLRNISAKSARLAFADELICVLQADNPNFKEGTFRAAADCKLDKDGRYVR